MKRILSLLTLLLFITACDDGDLTVDVIDFSEAPALKCPVKDVIYKVKGSEMLFIEIPSTYFTENETLPDEPIEVALSTTVKVTYRKYDDTVTQLNICPTVPDGTPNVVEEWKASSGIIQIKATAIKTTDTTTGATKITGYIYNITFKNITFEKPAGPQGYETFPFGNYSTTISPLAFGFDDQADKSTCDDRIFNFSGSEALILDVGTNYPTLFASTVTTTPRTALIDSTNKLTYKLFTNTVNNTYFCATTPPATPTLSQEWNAENGVEAVSGIIEVTTTTFGSDYQHTVHLRNVILRKGNSTFTLGNDYLYGSFITP
ncbi:hypothetical protein [Flavobacterium wongokense]|uniref:hypothetical protein n=1 Tax=Flavobacterium wongokense TaxID=2910674 RepID=UPI001F29E4A7|nr:hypothetical protein [Flavobacterium sp. WG47]MCF6133525.1 hypothetical protein [Flavobacterium sp. WG47]